MGQLSISLRGICTILSNGSVDGMLWGNRIVLVNASSRETIDADPSLRGLGIAPHLAQLQIPSAALRKVPQGGLRGFVREQPIPIPDPAPRDPVAWTMHRIALTIENAVGLPGQDGFMIAGGFLHLSDFVGGVMPPARPSLRERNGVPEVAACILESRSGALLAVQTGAALSGALSIVTDGEPRIRVHSFDDTNEELTIEVTSGYEVTLANGPRSLAEDKDQDFRLHYMTASYFPRLDGVPAPVTADMSTYGCSNSIYP